MDLNPVLDGRGNSVLGKYEDPFLYIDSAKSFHVIYYVYNTSEGIHGGKNACFNTTVSGHIFSEDGYTWHASPVPPYSARIAMDNGDAVTVSTRERPYLYFDRVTGEMTHLFNAVCGANGDQCAQYTGTGCVDCKYEQWDYNLVAPLDV